MSNDLIYDDSRDALIARLEDFTRPSVEDAGAHRVPDQDEYGPDRSKLLVSIDGQPVTKTLRQVQWYLENDRWEDKVITTCEIPGCITHIALEEFVKDEDLLALVQSDNKVSLAQLYQRGRQRGLISARSSGYGA